MFAADERISDQGERTGTLFVMIGNAALCVGAARIDGRTRIDALILFAGIFVGALDVGAASGLANETLANFTAATILVATT